MLSGTLLGLFLSADYAFSFGSSRQACSIGSEVCFLLGWSAEMRPGAVIGCAEHISNSVVFVRFHYLQVFCELDDIQSTFV